MLYIRLVGGNLVAFPLTHIKGFTPSRLRAAAKANR